MHSHSWRLLTAGHLHLDENLRDLSLAQDDHHSLIRDATLQSFEALIEIALEKRVDLVLLTGSISSSPLSLRACVTFRDGIEALLEEGIAVSWAITDDKEIQQLRKVDCLPRGVTLLGNKSKKRKVILGERSKEDTLRSSMGTISCEVIPERFSQEAKADGLEKNQWLSQIGITHYPIGHLPQHNSDHKEEGKYHLIISGVAERRHTTRHQNRLYHSPGAIQAQTEELTGACSVTLIEIDSEGEIELHPQNTSTVLYEQFKLALEREETEEEILERAENHLLEYVQTHSIETVQLMNLRWEFRGQHPALSQISSDSLKKKLSLVQPFEEFTLFHNVIVAPQLTGHELKEEIQAKHINEQFLRLLSEQKSDLKTKKIEQLEKQLRVQTGVLSSLLRELSKKQLNHRAGELGLQALDQNLPKAS